MAEIEPPPELRARDRELAAARAHLPRMQHVASILNESGAAAGGMHAVAIAAVLRQKRRERGLDPEAPYTRAEREEAVSILDEAHREVVAERAMEAERARIAAETRRCERIEKLLRDAGFAPKGEMLPAIVRGELDETEALREVRTWIDGPRRFLTMCGDGGTGKTVAATFAAAQAFRAKRVVVHVPEATLVELHKSNTNAARDELARIREAQLLVIEESGHTLAADAPVAGLVVFQLVNARIGMPDSRTIQVGNISLKDAVFRYGTRWSDRMREVGRVKELKLAPGERSMRARGERP